MGGEHEEPSVGTGQLQVIAADPADRPSVEDALDTWGIWPMKPSATSVLDTALM